MKGVSVEIRLKSSRVRSTPAARAIAIRCSVALVEPPVTITRRTAFSKAARVITSRGLMSRAMQVASASAARRHSSTFSGWSPPSPPLAAGSHAGMDEEYGTAIPRASMAEAIVLAVYMPPHAPGPGHALFTMSCRSSSPILPGEA